MSAGGAAGLAALAVQAFLAAREVAVLATLNPDGSPLAMPMWFLADAEAIIMLSVDGLAKVRNLRADPRVSVVAEAGERGNIRGVAVQGRGEPNRALAAATNQPCCSRRITTARSPPMPARPAPRRPDASAPSAPHGAP